MASTEPTLALPSSRSLWAMAVVAITLRLAITLIAARLGHVSLEQEVYHGDGYGYVHYARFILGQIPALTDYERRIFPGTPAAIALLLPTGMPEWLAGALPGWTGAAAACSGAAMLFADRRVGWLMAFFPPDSLMATTLVASEGVMLGFAVWGVIRFLKGDSATAGLLFGLAVIARPMACFAALACLVSAVSDRRWRSALIALLGTSCIVISALLWEHLRFGNSLQSAVSYRDEPSAYGGAIFDWPLRSLLYYSRHSGAGAAKFLFVWSHVAFAVITIGLLLRRHLADRSHALSRIALLWTAGNVAFCLCVGSIWGYLCFPRFLMPSLPPMVWAIDRWLPRRWYAWSVVAMPSIGLTLYMMVKQR